MRMILLAGAVLALSACGGGGDNANTTTVADNAAMDANVAMDPSMMTDQNGAMGAATTNGTVDANTQDLMNQDAATHDADTNLANGL
jgi:hypothetical protein